MSRIGKMPVEMVQGVKAMVQAGKLMVEGPKGKLALTLPEGIDVSIEGNVLRVNRKGDGKGIKAKHGLVRALAKNMVQGVSQGYEKRLVINGVGYRAAVKGKQIDLTLGFSHPVVFDLPEGVTAKVEANVNIILNSADKALLGEVASKIRGIKPPEPYQGKGIRYADEVIRRKAGKAAAGGK